MLLGKSRRLTLHGIERMQAAGAEFEVACRS